MMNVDNYYLVKYINANDVEFKEYYFATRIHKDMIESYLTVLKTEGITICNKERDFLGAITFKDIVGIYFNPATNDDEYNTILILVEEWED